MNRNIILFWALLLISVPAWSQKPNILWVTIEDSSPQFFGCYGNKDARTPVIDKLAAEGVRFTNAFSTGTVCSPSRSTIITGVRTYKMGTGNHRSNYPIPDYIKGFPYYLKQAGYYVTNNAKTDYNVGNIEAFIKEAWNESSNKAGWWNRQPGQPFFAVFNFNESHQSRTMTNPYEWYRKNVLEQLDPDERIGENEFDMPPFYNDTPEMRKQFARVYNSIKLTDKRIGLLLDRLEKDGLRDSTIIFFYADHGEGMPRGKTNGINYGYRVPFVIWFPPMYQHLNPWGKGVVSDELIDFEDLAPTIISLCGAPMPNYLKGRILLGPKRSKPVDHLILSADRSDNGIDMVRSITNGRFVYSRNYMPWMPETRYIRYMEVGEIKQLMRKDYAENKLNPLQRSIMEARPAEFLFDIENDLWETRNLANDPAYAQTIKKMRRLLDKEVLKARDVMFLPEYEIGLISKNETAYEYRLDEQRYPIKEIYAAASLSGKKGQDIATRQIKLLHSPNKIVRYWASIGLRSQNTSTLTPFRDAIERAIDDSYPPVAVTTAAIAFGSFQSEKGKTKLLECLNDDNQDLALMAINYLLYMENKQPFVKTIQKVHDKETSIYNVKAACMDFLGSMGLVPNDYDHKD